MNFMKNMSKNERASIFFFSALMVVLFLLLIFDDWVFKENGLNVMSPNDGIGQIETRQNDIRHRSKKSHEWRTAKEKQYIKFGDSIFAGKESQARLFLDSEGQVVINENSLIEFGRNIHQKTMNLKFGKFDLRVDGKMKIAINGKVTVVQGKKAEMHLNLEKGKSPKIKLVEGVASLKVQDKAEVKLDSESTTTLPVAPVEVQLKESLLLSSKPLEPENPVAIPTVTATTILQMPLIPERLNAVNKKTYTWRFSDFYERGQGLLIAKNPIMISHPVLLQGESPQSDLSLKATILLANNKELKNANILSSENGKIILDTVYPGENYYVVSFDNKNWTSIEKFKVNQQMSDNVPEIRNKKIDLILLEKKIATEIQIISPGTSKGNVVQFSNSLDFNSLETKTTWIDGSNLPAEFDAPGTYYYRFRNVDQNDEISDWSAEIMVVVMKPEIPKVPKILYADREGMIEENYRIEWDSEEANTVMTIVNESNQEMTTKESNLLKWRPSKPGVYFAKARVKNKYSQFSEFSEPVKIHVAPKPVVIAEVKPKIPAPPKILYADREGIVEEKFRIVWNSEAANTVMTIVNQSNQEMTTKKSNLLIWVPSEPGIYFAKARVKNKYSQFSEFSEPVKIHVSPKPVVLAKISPKREPVSIENEISIQLKEKKPMAFYNENYNSRKVSLSGDVLRQQSSRQFYVGERAPISMGLGFKYFGWIDMVGIEGIIKSSVLSMSENSIQTSSQSIEARVHRRFLIDFPLSLVRQLQISFFLGGENVQNTNELFASNYNLVKIGNRLEFPFSRFWGGGGEFVYGGSSKRNTKKELSGHLYYFYNPRFSLGLGYRFYLFEAGSADSAPAGFLPYREGGTEAYSILNYHY